MVEKDVAIAIDTGGTRGRVAAISLTGGILGQRIFDMYTFDSPDQPTKAAITATDEILGETGLLISRILGVSHASAGVHDRKTYTVTFSPNVSEEILPLDMAVPVADHLKIGRKEIFNDCTSGAFAEWLYGWRPEEVSILAGLPSPSRRTNIPRAYWLERRLSIPQSFGDVVYVTISTGENHGRIHNGQLDTGGHGTTPEGGHAPGVLYDLFGNPIECGCGGEGHIEGAVSMKGLAKVVYNAYHDRKIKGSALALAVTELEDRHSEDREALLAALPPVFYRCVRAGDEIALEINGWHNEQVARLISALVCYLGPQIIAFGGSGTKNMRYSMLPAFSLYREMLEGNDYGGLQPLENQPALAVCKDYGNDHVLLGAAAGLFRQEFDDDVFASLRK